MMKYYIAVEEKRSTVIEVEADNLSQAIDKVDKAYERNEINLNSDIYTDDIDFLDETDKWKKAIDDGYKICFEKIR